MTLRGFAVRVLVVLGGVSATSYARAQAPEAPPAPPSEPPVTGEPPATPAPASQQDVDALRREVQDLQKRLEQVQAQPPATGAAPAGATPTDKPAEKPAEKVDYSTPMLPEARSEVSKDAKAGPGAPIRIVDTKGTDVQIYGILEPSFIFRTNANKDGKSQGGLDLSWFSGNRWGIYGRTLLEKSSQLRIIGRLESEFELPTGDMDTKSVLFNRDAWLGIESPLIGKLTVGRQNTLARDVTNIYGDPYGAAALSTREGGYTNNNNFKQLIFYSGGGAGAKGQFDTRFDSGIVWKKVFDVGLYLGLAYAFGDGNGPGGPNGSGPVPGAGIDKGSVQTAAVGWNAGPVHVSAMFNHTDVLEQATIGKTNVGHDHYTGAFGGNVDLGVVRFNAGFIHYSADQGAMGKRTDNAVTGSVKVAPSEVLDFELGWQDMFAQHAGFISDAKFGFPGVGITYIAYQDMSGATTVGSGSRMTTFGSIIYHPVRPVDVYLVSDYMRTSGDYSDYRSFGNKDSFELGTGVRWRF